MSAETIDRPTVADVHPGLLALQEEVPGRLIGKLPKVTCGECRKKENRGQCQEHKKAQCEVCHGWITTAHMHLDYVGHAETTSKLLEVDPYWNWEPLAFGQDGLPTYDSTGGLWIRLTVCGVTRLGYGTADNANGFKNPGDLKKEIIGDAIRNAAMRYGWGLNLWAKADIHERQIEEQREAAPPPRPELPPFAAPGDLSTLETLLRQKLGPLSPDALLAQVKGFIRRSIWSLAQVFAPECAAMIRSLTAMADYQEPGEVPQDQAPEQDPAAVADRIECDLLERIRECTTSGELGTVVDRAYAEQQGGRIGQVHLKVVLAAVDRRLAEQAGPPATPGQAPSSPELTGAAQ